MIQRGIAIRCGKRDRSIYLLENGNLKTFPYSLSSLICGRSENLSVDSFLTGKEEESEILCLVFAEEYFLRTGKDKER